MNPGIPQDDIEGRRVVYPMIGTKAVTSPVEVGKIISPNVWVYDPLKLTSTLLGL